MSSKPRIELLESASPTITISENISVVEVLPGGNRTLTISVPGTQGPRGAYIFSGEGAPDDSLGIAGDWYFDTVDRVLYGPKTSTWPGTGMDLGRVTGRHVHVQAVAAASWTIDHNLYGRPHVLVFDDQDDHIITEVDYTSETQVVVSSPTAFTGVAYLT